MNFKPVRQTAQKPAAPQLPPLRSAGAASNQANLRRLQAKLTIGPVDDPLEHEADATADRVMRMSDTTAPAGVTGAASTPQPKAASVPADGTAPASVSAALQTPGQPLATGLRDFFEPRFGADFSTVRVHHDAQAARSAQEIGATAYATGQDLVFAPGAYAPESQAGRQLIAHELTHVLQQRPERIFRQPPPAPAPAQAPAQTPAPAPPTPQDEINSAVGAPTSGQKLSLEVTIPGGTELPPVPSDDPDRVNIIKTGAATTIRISLSATGAAISFTPALIITSHGVKWSKPDADVAVSYVQWDFGTQTVTASVDPSWKAKHFSDVDPKVLVQNGVMAALRAHLPARMFVAGYNPLTDTAIIADIGKALGGGASGALPVTSGELAAEFTLDAEVAKMVDGRKIVFPAGTVVRLSAAGKPAAAAGGDPRIDKIAVDLRPAKSGSPMVKVSLLGTDIGVVALQGVALKYGGSLDFGYRLITEDIATLGNLIVLLLAVRENPAAAAASNPSADTLIAKQTKLRALIESDVKPAMEKMVRDLVLAHKGALPGIDLAKALGIAAP